MSRNQQPTPEISPVSVAPRERAKGGRILFVTDFYLEGMLAGIVDFAREAGWDLDANMRLHGRFPPADNAAGILATVRGERVRDWLAKQNNCPIVRMLVSPFDLPYPAVEADYRAAGEVGARHLLELGHVHFAFYALQNSEDTAEAWSGFSSVLKAGGRRATLLDWSAQNLNRGYLDVARDERCRWLAGELQRLPKPLAIMGDDDRRVLDVLTACEMVKLRVPEDVVVLGCDNHWVEQRMAEMPISSVDMNFKGMGWHASRMLQQLIDGKTLAAPVLKISPLGVLARRSTAAMVTDSPEITAAVSYLREHFHERLRVSELAKRSGMSERVFEKEFKRCLGRSAREEILRARLACAARLLRDTDLKLEAIANESGFGSAAQLCRAFIAAYGSSPNVWRQQVKQAVVITA
ncbi:MAG TPA: substrate-binding domain-containing protein [Dongiaceae bacterium]|nr:substrate-binding domain-containing protein [Dongiaceae bacterium]